MHELSFTGRWIESTAELEFTATAAHGRAVTSVQIDLRLERGVLRSDATVLRFHADIQRRRAQTVRKWMLGPPQPWEPGPEPAAASAVGCAQYQLLSPQPVAPELLLAALQNVTALGFPAIDLSGTAQIKRHLTGAERHSFPVGHGRHCVADSPGTLLLAAAQFTGLVIPRREQLLR